jgi:hypothetical protein
MEAQRRLVVNMMALRHIRDRMMSGIATRTDAEAMATLAKDEIAAISVTRMSSTLDFTSAREMGRWMEERMVYVAGTRGRSRSHCSIPEDLHEELFGSSSFMHGGPYEIHDLLTPIADKLQVDANERAIILAIDSLANSRSEQEAIAGDLMRSLEEMRAHREAAETMVAKQAQEIDDIEFQINAMCEVKCARGEYEARQTLRAVDSQLGKQRSVIAMQESQLRQLNARIEKLEEEVAMYKRLNEEHKREIEDWGARAASLEAQVRETHRTREKLETRWPVLATLVRAAEENAYKEPKGYRLDEPMRALVARSQLIPKAIWKAHFVPLGWPGWRTRNYVFSAILDRMGVGVDVFDGHPEHMDRLLRMYFPSGCNSRICVSLDAISVAPCLSVDFKRGVLTGGIVDAPLTDEQLMELRERPEVLQDFIFSGGVQAMCAMWIVAVNLVDDVPGRHSLPLATLPATKGVADDHVVSWFGGIMEHLGGYPSVQWFATDGDPRLVRQFLRPVAARVLGWTCGKCRHICGRCPAIYFCIVVIISRSRTLLTSGTC